MQIFYAANGCILGDPNGEHTVIQGWSQVQIKAKEIASSNSTTLVRKFMDAFFTKNELVAGCCTEVDGRELLGPDIIDGIRSRLLTSYSLFMCQFIPTITFGISEAVSYFSIMFTEYMKLCVSISAVHIKYKYPRRVWRSTGIRCYIPI